MYFKPRIFRTQYFTSVHQLTNISNISMYPFCVTHLPEDGHMCGRNMQEVYCVYNILSYSYMHLLVSLLYLVTVQICVGQVPRSNFGRHGGYPDGNILWLYFVSTVMSKDWRPTSIRIGPAPSTSFPSNCIPIFLPSTLCFPKH